VAEYKINIQISVAVLYNNIELVEKEARKANHIYVKDLTMKTTKY
jgi:hypothetical protein